MSRRILVVDDDRLVGVNLKLFLEREGFRVDVAHECASARAAVLVGKPDLVLLDIGLPDCSGLDLARWLHTQMRVRFIFLTARDQEIDTVLGLELGAEDYITKPFSRREMLARIRVALRHVRRPEMDSDTPGLAINGIVLDTRRRAVRVRGTPVDLPRIEFELLRVLMANAGTALARDQLLQEVWGRSLGVPFQVLYVHIGCLRNRIELDPRHPQLIQTVRHVGYKFAGPAF